MQFTVDMILGQRKQTRHPDQERAEDRSQHQEDPHEIPGQECPQPLEENDGKVSYFSKSKYL